MSTINHFKSGFDDTRETVTVNGRIAIREALPGLDFENSVIAVNGFEADENYVLQENDICAVRTFPKGAPGSSPLEITLGILTLGAYTACDSIVAGATGKTIGQHFQNALMNWLAQDAPNANNGADGGLANIPQLRGAKNQSNKNRPIPIVLGKHLFTPMYIGSPYTEIGGEDGEDQYFTALYLLGWGKLEVSDVRLGPVSGLAKNAGRKTDGFLLYDKNDKFCDPSFADSSPQLELRQGPNPNRADGEVSLYPQRVVEERLSIELMNAEGKSPLEAIRFSAQDPQKVQIEFTFNNGLVSYDDKGGKQDASVGIKVEWRDKPGEDPDGGWQEFGRIGTNGGHSPTSYDSATRTTTITRKKNKAMRFTAERSFAYDEVKGAAGRTIELRIIRANSQPTDGRTADTVFLTAIRTWCFDNEATEAANGVMKPQAPMIQKYRDKTARLGFRIKAAENLQGTIDALNCIVQSYARVWNGSDWNGPEEPTSNPAGIALKILQSPALGNNAYPDSMLDLDSFGEFYEWCKEREYTCNGVLASEKRVDDLLNAILATGRGMRILNGSRYAVLIDKPRENPVTILNSQNVLEASNQKTFEDLPDGFSIKFVNELDGYQETEVYVMADGSARPGPMSRIESIEMPFVTDYRQAVKNGRYMLACRRLRPEIWNRKLSVDGYLIGIGDLVEVQDDTILVGIGEGAVIKGLRIENDAITEIQTDGVFDVTDTAQQYGIKVMQFDGVYSGKVRTIGVTIPKPGVYSDFAVTTPIPVSGRPVPGIGDIAAFGIYGRITTPAICFGKKPNGDGTFDVTLIPYQEGVYTTDSGEIPPYRTNITAPQGMAPLAEVPPDPVSRGDMLEAISEIDLSGQASVVYELRSSVNIIRKDNDGTAVPGAISCSQIMIAGNSPPAPSNMTLSYITSENGAAVLYTGPVPVGSWDWIEFILSDRGIELDRETVHALRDGSDAVVLDIENQNYPVFCHHDGQPKEGELPFSVQATLYLGANIVTDAFWSLDGAPRGITINQGGLITVAAEYRYADGMPRYPAQGEGGAADPMPGPFYPCPPESEWPAAQTLLGTSAEITVRALFRGQAHARKLRIRKVLDGAPGEQGGQGEQGDPAPRYLGKTVTKTTTNTVFIQFTSAYSANVAANVGDYVLYIGTSEAGASPWKKNFLLQWNGAQWIQLDPLSSANTDYYMGALRDMEGEELGAFNVLFAQKIMTIQAAIDELFARIITLKHPGVLKSANFTEETPTTRGEGFKFTSFGDAELYNCRKFTLLESGDIAIGHKRCYIDNDEILLQEYIGGNMWKTIAALGLAASLGLLSCRGTVDSDVILSPSTPFGTNAVYSIGYGNGKFVAGSSGNAIAYSPDGINWTAVSNSTFGPQSIYGITYGNGKFVAGGLFGAMIYSPDGINWTAVSNSTETTNIYDITFANGKFVAVGTNGKIVYSTNGINWTAVSNSTFGNRTILSITYGNGKFVAGSLFGAMAYSPDGINWTAVSNSTFGSQRIDSITYDGSKFVAVGGIIAGPGIAGNGAMAYSPDGINWTAVSNHPLMSNNIEVIIYNNNKFLAGNANGTMAQSPDGINWVLLSSPFNSSILSISYGNGRFVAGGFQGKLVYMLDGEAFWQSRAGFLEKHVTASATKYKLFDGKWINLNSNGSVTWSDS